MANGIITENAKSKNQNAGLLIDVLRSRSEFYLMLARFYAKPLTQSDIDRLREVDYSKTGAGEPLIEAGFNDIARFLRRQHTGIRQQLATDFTMTFDGVATWEDKVAVPYASVFLSEEGLLAREPRNEVFLLFKKEALRLKEGVNLPEDHLSFELEFLSIMSLRSVDALKADDREQALRNLKISANFIREHLLTWFEMLNDRAMQLLETRFYQGVLKITKGYLNMDLVTIADLVDEIETL
ncbi:MAG: molecular chaperone TorD family protein [Coriobacteriales bacterium]|jgi:TorA maturation chaperone TorD|nr:molecular chaperone TorD family protein [Coriobacteriales bacterium]